MNKETSEFFEKHNIDLKFTIDAMQNVINENFKNLMRSQNKYYAYNTNLCEKGHNIKSRSNHCLICDSYDIKIYKELYDSGFIYIAGSKKLKLIKIGSSKDNLTVAKRQLSLNDKKGYAETNDWKILVSYFCDKRGFHEKEIHKLLKPNEAVGYVYTKDDLTNATEIYRCSYKKANEICENYFKDLTTKITIFEKKMEDYAFPNIKKM